MSDEKTKITHTGDRARFLGYDVTVSRDQTLKKTANGSIHFTVESEEESKWKSAENPERGG